MDILWHHGHFSTWRLQHWDILGLECFETFTFWLRAKQYRHFVIDISARVPLCQNVHVSICPWCGKIPMQNDFVLKCPCAEKSLWWNVHTEMSLAEISGAKIRKGRMLNFSNFFRVLSSIVVDHLTDRHVKFYVSRNFLLFCFSLATACWIQLELFRSVLSHFFSK